MLSFIQNAFENAGFASSGNRARNQRSPSSSSSSGRRRRSVRRLFRRSSSNSNSSSSNQASASLSSSSRSSSSSRNNSNSNNTRTVAHVEKRIVCDLLHLRLKQIPIQQQGTLECLICADEMKTGCLVTRLPCGHLYHSSCCLPWMERSATCPTCRHVLRTVPFVEPEDVQPESSSAEQQQQQQQQTDGQSQPPFMERSIIRPTANDEAANTNQTAQTNDPHSYTHAKTNSTGTKQRSYNDQQTQQQLERNPEQPVVLGAFCGSGDMIRLSLHRPSLTPSAISISDEDTDEDESFDFVKKSSVEENYQYNEPIDNNSASTSTSTAR